MRPHKSDTCPVEYGDVDFNLLSCLTDFVIHLNPSTSKGGCAACFMRILEAQL